MDISWERFKWETGISQCLSTMLLVCFTRALMTDPGSVPDTPEWKDMSAQNQQITFAVVSASSGSSGEEPTQAAIKQHEVKQTGQRRICKWCDHFKPDRTHHCRVCKSCVIRMDHHCPWIVNCVGFRNHKYFFLLVFYALLNCIFIVLTMMDSLSRTLIEYTTSTHRFFLVFGMTLSMIMLVLLVVFFWLHVWMMCTATTTIEFCEKRCRMNATPNWSQGLWQDLKNVLGPWPILWFLPIMPPQGEGIYFFLTPEEGNGAPLLKAVPVAEPEESESDAIKGETRRSRVLTQLNYVVTDRVGLHREPDPEAAAQPEVTGKKAAVA
jgi:hypothetical protein